MATTELRRYRSAIEAKPQLPHETPRLERVYSQLAGLIVGEVGEVGAQGTCALYATSKAFTKDASGSARSGNAFAVMLCSAYQGQFLPKALHDI